MKYRIVGSGTDSVGHRLLILQNQKSLDIIQAFDTEIEVRPCHYQVQYVLKAITLDDRRVWLQTTSNLPDAVAAKNALDWILNNALARKEDTS